MNHAALEMQTFPDFSAVATAVPTTKKTNARNDPLMTDTVSVSRFDFGALRQMLLNAQEIAVSPDVAIGAVDLPSNPIDVSRWNVLFAAVNVRIAETVALMSSEAYWRNDLPGANGGRTVMLECAEALAQLQIMFPLYQPELTPLQRELVDTRAALVSAQAALRKSQMQARVARELALHDALTSLPNRTFMMWHLKHALSESMLHQQPVAVLYLDLDGLKPVNDQHGHDVGDAMLVVTARRLLEAVPPDTVVSRLGGDEFVCLLKHANNRQELSTLARALIEAVSAELHIGDRHVAVRPSIGIAISQADGATPEVLLKHADAAMYRAKRSHAGCVFWDDH